MEDFFILKIKDLKAGKIYRSEKFDWGGRPCYIILKPNKDKSTENCSFLDVEGKLFIKQPCCNATDNKFCLANSADSFWLEESIRQNKTIPKPDFHCEPIFEIF